MNRCFSLLASLLIIISSWSSAVMPVVAQDNGGHQAIIDPTLRQQLQEATPSAIVTVIIELGEKEDLQSISATTRAQRVKSVVTRLQQRAERSQKPIQALLRQRQQEGKVRDFTSFWIFNGLKVSATPQSSPSWRVCHRSPASQPTSAFRRPSLKRSARGSRSSAIELKVQPGVRLRKKQTCR